MRQLRLFRLLLQPSLFSFAAISLLAVLMLSVAGWSGLVTSRLGYDYLSLGSIFDTTPEAARATVHALFAGQVAYIIFVGVVALGVSLGVYLFLDTIEQGVANMLRTIFTLRHKSDDHHAKAETSVRVGFHALTLVGWGVYGVLFAVFLLPVCANLFKNSVTDLAHMQWGPLVLAYVGLWLALHVHVLFLRLFLQRPRVFGGADVIAAGLE